MNPYIQHALFTLGAQKLFLLLTALLLRVAAGSTQTLPEVELEIARFQQQIAKGPHDKERLTASDSCARWVEQMCGMQGAFAYPFDSLYTMCTLTSPDGAFRLFNWNIPMDDQSHRYRCFMVMPPDERGFSEWVELKALSKEPDKLASRSFDQDEWLGCLYYQIIPPQGKKDDVYMLLGWEGHNRMSNRKFIETLSFQRGMPRFGSAVIKLEKGVQKRMVFEYAKEVSMSLRFHEKDRRIVYDHLSPRAKGLEGNYAFYGPDLTFDALRYEKGNWKEEKDVDMRLDRDDKPYKDPRRRRQQ
jgi:hypothetical protein